LTRFATLTSTLDLTADHAGQVYFLLASATWIVPGSASAPSTFRLP